MTDNRTVLKVELHAHTSQDPLDYIPHTMEQLLDRASALGYGALAVTLHNRYYDPAEHRDYARERGIVLISGIERTIRGRHVLLLNFPPACADVDSFEAVRALRMQHPRGLVIVPHAFYPTGTGMGSLVDTYVDVIDAVEVNAMFTPWLDFNRAAARWARAHGKPLVGNSDLHLLEQLGTTYSLVDAAPDPDAICEAIRAGRVHVRSSALTSVRAGWVFARMLANGAAGRLRGLTAGRQTARPDHTNQR